MTRAIVALARMLVVATVCMLLIQGARAWGSAADRSRPAHEIVAREADLYRRLAERNAIYRRIVALRARASVEVVAEPGGGEARSQAV
jgi:hypothetical protein